MGRPAKALSGFTGPRVQIPPSPPRDGDRRRSSHRVRCGHAVAAGISNIMHPLPHGEDERLLDENRRPFRGVTEEPARNELGTVIDTDFHR